MDRSWSHENVILHSVTMSRERDISLCTKTLNHICIKNKCLKKHKTYPTQKIWFLVSEGTPFEKLMFGKSRTFENVNTLMTLMRNINKHLNISSCIELHTQHKYHTANFMIHNMSTTEYFMLYILYLYLFLNCTVLYQYLH